MTNINQVLTQIQIIEMTKNDFKQNKKGFSLTEVLVATIVMSMIMGSVLAFVQYAGNIWHKGNEKISSQNYTRMAFELLKQDLLEATSVSTPKVGLSSDKIIYKKPDNNKSYKITASEAVLLRTSSKLSSATMRIAKNVGIFYVNRISSRTFEIALQIQGDEIENEDGTFSREIISSESMVLIAPGVQ